MERPGAPLASVHQHALCLCGHPELPDHNVRRPQVKASWTAVYGIIAKTMIGDNYPEA